MLNLDEILNAVAMPNGKIALVGRAYLKASNAEFLALYASEAADPKAECTFFFMRKTDMIAAIESENPALRKLFGVNSEGLPIWKGLRYMTVKNGLAALPREADAHKTYAEFPCETRLQDMPKDKRGNRSTWQEKFVAAFTGGNWVGGLRNSGGIAAGESGRLADVVLINGAQVEVKGYHGRLGGMYSIYAIKKMLAEGRITIEDVLRRTL